MNFLAYVALRNITIIEFDESVQSEVFLTSGEIDDKGGGKIYKSVKFVHLTKVDHVPNESLFIGQFSMELKVVVAEALLTKLMILKSKRILSPLEKYTLLIATFDQAFALRKGTTNRLMVIALAEVVVAYVVTPLLDRLHSIASSYIVAGWCVRLSYEALGFPLCLAKLPSLIGFWGSWSWQWVAFDLSTGPIGKLLLWKHLLFLLLDMRLQLQYSYY